MSGASNVVPLPVDVAPENDLVLIAPGIYSATYVSHNTTRSFGGRLVMQFRITQPGAGFEKVLPAWYNARIIDMKARTFSVRPQSKFARDWRVIFRGGTDRWDRLPMSAFRDLHLLVRVRTVDRDYEQKPLDPINHHSIIDGLLGRAGT